MSGWTSDELARIGTAEELNIAAIGAEGSLRGPVTIWVVRIGDELYVRSWRGAGGSWWRNATARGAGRITAGGVEKECQRRVLERVWASCETMAACR